MSKPNIEDFRFSSSSVDDFFQANKPRLASGGVIRIAKLSDLSDFQIVAGDKLVHLSKSDFWKLGQDEDGHFIERLVNDDSGPVIE
jgi:hypothetical protein